MINNPISDKMSAKPINIPRVSIGLPVYNGEHYISETLDSLINQTYKDFELIISDNASTDGTEQICLSYSKRDERIRYFRNSINLGAAKNYQLAFEPSLGKYFRWANSDDLFAPDSLLRCVEILDREPKVILVYPKTKFIDEHGRFISENEDNLNLQSNSVSERFIQLFERLEYVNAIYGLMRTDILRKTGLIRNFIGGDIPLMAELTLYGKFWEIPEFLFFRRFHPKALSSSKEIAQIQEFFDPKTKGRLALTEWKHYIAHIDSVRRAPLEVNEKIRIFYFLIQMALWNRHELAGELSEATRILINSLVIGNSEGRKFK